MSELSSIRVIFITRRYPPSVGGMQRFSSDLAEGLNKVLPCVVIAWKHDRGSVFPFMPFALFYSIVTLWRFRNQLAQTIVHLGDTVLTPIGLFLRFLFGVPVVVSTHGLDVVYAMPLYQTTVVQCLKYMSAVVCNSRATSEQCLRRGVLPERCFVIKLGTHVSREVAMSDCLRQDISQAYSIDPHSVWLLVAARLIPRKGVSWFVENVMPLLKHGSAAISLLIVGDGPEKRKILALIKKLNLTADIHYLGEIAMQSPELAALYRSMDLLVMPYLRVSGQIEGYGLVAAEAGAAGKWTVASNLDGIRDVVQDGVNGTLVPPQDVSAWVTAISSLIQNPHVLADIGLSAREFVSYTLSLERMVSNYVHLYEHLVYDNQLLE